MSSIGDVQSMFSLLKTADQLSYLGYSIDHLKKEEIQKVPGT